MEKLNSDLDFSFEKIDFLKHSHTSWRLLCADTASLIISFCHRMFILHNRRSIPEEELETSLADYLYQIRDNHNPNIFPRAAKEYLEVWASDECGYLRKYYPQKSEQAEFDITPATEQTIEWLQSLQPKAFIGTESLLLVMFQILRDIVQSTESSPEERLKTLEKQKQEIELQIENVKAGNPIEYNSTQIKERFMQAEETGRKLLSQFRQIEFNFRQLDRETRERIAQCESTKGTLLEEVFLEHDTIRNSDQGQSFKAFWEFLMSTTHQQELQDLLTYIYQLDEVKELALGDFLKKIAFLLIDAGEQVYTTHQTLAQQLRKFLDDRVFIENKRIFTLMQDIEKQALSLEARPKRNDFTNIESMKIHFDTIMNRTLYQVPRNPIITDIIKNAEANDINIDNLFQVDYVDETLLLERIEKALLCQPQLSLRQLIIKYPIEKGLAEIVTYLKLATQLELATIVEDEVELISFQQGESKEITIELNKIIFARQL